MKSQLRVSALFASFLLLSCPRIQGQATKPQDKPTKAQGQAQKTRQPAAGSTTAPTTVPTTPTDSAGPDSTKTPPTFQFGKWKIGTQSSPIPVALKNPAKSKVKFSIVPDNDSKPDFQIEKNHCKEEVDEGASCLVEITFSPRAEGTRSSTWQVSYAADSATTPTKYDSWSLGGIGVLPDLGVSSSHLEFEAPKAHQAETSQTITLTNNTKADTITISKLFTTGDFEVGLPSDSKPGEAVLSLKPAESKALVVTFHAKHGGKAKGLLTILSDASESPENVELSGAPREMWNELCMAPHRVEIGFIILIGALYWLGVLTARWHRIARPTRELLRTQITSVETELGTLTGNQPTVKQQNVAGLLVAAKDLIDPAKEQFWNRLLNFLYWSRGQEISGWGYVHEAQVQMAQFLGDQTVRARLEMAEQRLRITNDAVLLALADRIHQEFQTSPLNIDRCKALLAEALNGIYGRDDTDYAKLVSWQNKATWLVVCGLLLMVAVTIAIPHHSILLVVGGAGGLISRLTRSLDRKDVPTDYGASWTTLFLSPVSGALGAWAGILAVALATQLNVLGSAFNQAKWDDPCNQATLALALIFGFSERLLDNVLEGIESKSGGGQDKPSTSPGTKNTAAPKAQDGPQVPAKPNNGGLQIQNEKLSDGTIGKPYAEKLTATGNQGDVSWTIKEGKPDWLNIDGIGQLGGTPTVGGVIHLTVEAKDQVTSAPKTFDITINVPKTNG